MKLENSSVEDVHQTYINVYMRNSFKEEKKAITH